jgi:hypothetical protein
MATYMFELRRHGGDGGERANCGDEASGRSNNDRDDGWRWTAPSVTVTAPCEVPSLRAHVEETLLPSVERLGGLGVYTSARSDLLAEEAELALHAARVAGSIAGLTTGSTAGPVAGTRTDGVCDILKLSLDAATGLKSDVSARSMIVAVFVCIDDRIDHVVVYTTVLGSVPPAPTANGHAMSVACIVGPPRARPGIKDIAWIRDRKDLEERGKRATEALGYGIPSDVLLCTEGGDLLEGLITNLFVVVEVEVEVEDAEGVRGSHVNSNDNDNDDGSQTGQYKLQTAPEGTVLPGIARRKVIEACRELGIPVDLTCPSLSERHLWREAFLTNSIRQIQSLDRICCVQTNVLGLEPWEVAFDRADGARPRQTLTGMISGMIRTDSTRE